MAAQYRKLRVECNRKKKEKKRKRKHRQMSKNINNKKQISQREKQPEK